MESPIPVPAAKATPATVKIEVLAGDHEVWHRNARYKAGDVIEMSPESAEVHLKAGHARLVK